jgi:hypothetical protein
MTARTGNDKKRQKAAAKTAADSCGMTTKGQATLNAKAQARQMSLSLPMLCGVDVD